MEKITGVCKPLLEQLEIFENILLQNEQLKGILEKLSKTNLKNYYLAAGSINQTIFNYYHNYPLDYGIKDYDIVYFDSDLSYEKEDQIIQMVQSVLEDSVEYDIKNEARVHLWRKEKYGNDIIPYTSVEDAISRWGATITCIGVRLENSKLIVYAPYGLEDIFSMTVRPIKEDFSKELYEERALKWKSRWPLLTVLPWDY